MQYIKTTNKFYISNLFVHFAKSNVSEQEKITSYHPMIWQVVDIANECEMKVKVEHFLSGENKQ